MTLVWDFSLLCLLISCGFDDLLVSAGLERTTG